jgi:phage terminase Nu1 subunit (DNA packaging protein)
LHVPRRRYTLSGMAIPRLVDTADLASALSVDERSIRRLVRQGVLARDEMGFDLADSVARYVAHREGIVAARAGSSDYGKARASLYVERAAKMKLEREEREGALVRVSDVIAMMTSLVGVTKTRLLAIPTKCAPLLILKRIPAEVMAILTKEIREALEDLSNAEVVATKSGKLPKRGRAA